VSTPEQGEASAHRATPPTAGAARVERKRPAAAAELEFTPSPAAKQRKGVKGFYPARAAPEGATEARVYDPRKGKWPEGTQPNLIGERKPTPPAAAAAPATAVEIDLLGEGGAEEDVIQLD